MREHEINSAGYAPPALIGHAGALKPIEAAQFDPAWGDQAADASPAISPAVVWRAFRRHWYFIVPIWLVLTLVVVYAVYAFVRPTYESFAILKIETSPITIAGQPQVINLSEFQKSQVALITQPDVLYAALADEKKDDGGDERSGKPRKSRKLRNLPSLKDVNDAETTLRKLLTVSEIPGTSLIQISMSSEHPLECPEIINAVAEEYLRQSVTWADKDGLDKTDRLTKEIDAQKTKLDIARKNVSTLTEKTRTLDEQTLRRMVQGRFENYLEKSKELEEVTGKLNQLQDRRDVLERRLAQSAGSAGPGSNDALIKSLVEQDQDVQTAAAAYQKLKDIALRHLKKVRDQTDPAYTEAFDRAKDAGAKLNGIRRAAYRRIEAQLLSRPDGFAGAATPQAELERLADEITLASAEKGRLEQTLHDMKVQSSESGKDEAGLAYAKEDEKRESALLDKLRDQKTVLEFDLRQPHRVKLQQEAKISLLPQSNKRKAMMAGAPVALLGLVLGAFTLLEIGSGRVATPSDLTSRTRLKVIGVVPPLPDRQAIRHEKDEIRAQRELHEFIQSVDHLRVNLCAGRHNLGKDVRCVLITSACGHEGKTTLAAQLAGRCANAGLMTLLIDADLRSPTLSKLLDVPQGPGLVDMLRGDADTEAATVLIGDAGGFHLLPAGAPEFDPSRLLQGARFGQLLSKFRETFDIVIVDAPPVLPVPDALTLGKWVDGAVLAVRHDSSRFALVKEAQNRLFSVGVPILGAVVNGVRDPHGFAYGYGYGYGGNPRGETETAGADAAQRV